MSGRGGEAKLTASRDAPLGGQAVLEGVMMRGISTWAVAVRKLDGVGSTCSRSRWWRGPSGAGSTAGR